MCISNSWCILYDDFSNALAVNNDTYMDTQLRIYPLILHAHIQYQASQLQAVYLSLEVLRAVVLPTESFIHLVR